MSALFEINDKNYYEASMSQWQNHFEKIYGERNRGKDPEIIWFRVLENASKVAESLRRYEYGNAFIYLAHMFCWTLGFCSLTRRNVKDTVWKKYPYVCPYCRKDRENVFKSCTCMGQRREIEETPTHEKERMLNEQILAHFRTHFAKKKPKKLDDWVLMFAKIYDNANYSASVEHIGFHLMEEVGEVSRVFRRMGEYEKRVKRGFEEGTDINKAREQYELDLDYEIADVFSWMCALISKISSIIEAVENYGEMIKIILPRRRAVELKLPEVTLSSFIFSEYGMGCPNCQQMMCSEDCFLTECKFMIGGKKCGFDWKGKKLCDYGKTREQSYSCGTISSKLEK